MRKLILTWLSLAFLVFARNALALDIALLQGWNLVANPGAQIVNIAATFGNSVAPVPGVSANVQTVWAWNPVTRNWAFYTPSLPDGGAAHAAQNGFEFLGTAPIGQGFWVNASAPFTLTLANAVTGNTMDNFIGSYSGTYSGTASFGGFTLTDSGTWTATVAASGLASGTITSNSGFSYSASGTVTNNGATTLTFGTVGSGTLFSGAVNPFTAQMSGTWNNGSFTGTFTGVKQ